MSSWPLWRTLTQKWETSSSGLWSEAVRLMQMSRLGGSSETDDMAVAVTPIGSPRTQTGMTLTVEATRRIACFKSWGGALSALADARGASGGGGEKRGGI